MGPLFAAFDPTFGAGIMALAGTLLFGAPMALLVIVLLRRPLTRRMTTLGRAWCVGVLAGGTTAVVCVGIVFGAAWTINLGWAGWMTYWSECLAGSVYVSVVAGPLGALFGGLLYSEPELPPASVK
jgi:hypothetical protein